jgi:NNP family nitrate/nitrite transporter-like MFS transporter
MSKPGNLVTLAVTTWAFVVCFAVWLMFGVTGIPIRRELGLNGLEFGLLTSTPVLTGALFRLPLGVWTDRFGGRIVMLVLLVVGAVPLWLSSYANQLWQFLLLGLALGVVGASFAVGTPYVARLFPKERRGFAMGGHCHMWTPPVGKSFFYERVCKTVGCSHMSGLCARLLWPLAPMISADRSHSR